MRIRIDNLIDDLGCAPGDETLVRWNTSPGAIVMIERLLLRIHALEQTVEALTARQKAVAPRPPEKTDVSASA